MFSESPPLMRKNSGQPQQKAKQLHHVRKYFDEELLYFVVGNSLHNVNSGRKFRICKVKTNEIALKYRSEENTKQKLSK